MKKLLILLLFLPLLAQAQFTPGSWKRPSNISPGEYINNLYDSLTHQCSFTFSGIVPSLWTNQPAYSWKQRGGPHDAGIIDTLGGLHMSGANNVGQDGIGSTTSTATGAMVTVTTDVNSNPLPPIQDIFMTLNPTNGENWFTLIFSTVASGGRVWVAGCTQDGMSGDGTAGSAAQTKFKPVTMPNSDTIVKVEGYQMVLALSNHDSVISWGMNNSAYGLGQGASPVHSAPSYVHLPTGWHAYDIGGGGIMSYILADSAVTHYKIFSFGWQYDPGYQGLGASGTVLTTPQDVTSKPFMTPMTGHTHAVKVTCNTETTYFTCADGTLWDIGGNAVGTIGNGQSLNFAIYTTNPAPYGGTQSWPYAWDESQGELMVDTIYHVLPGVTDIDTVYTAHSNSWFLYLRELNGNDWGWGRNKSTAIVGNQIDQNNGKSVFIIDANYNNGNIASSYPDSWTTVWPNFIVFPNATGYEISQTSSPYCVTHGSSSPCNIYSIPTTAAPTVNAGSNQNISTSTTNLAGVASGNGGSIVNFTTWTQVSGPNTAVITAPGYQGTLVSNLITGTYTFKDSATDNNWRTNTATMTVTVGASSQTAFYFSAAGSGTACTSAAPCPISYWPTVNAELVGGDVVYFNRADVFPGDIVVSASGTAGNDILITATPYGTGPEPILGGMTTLSGWTNSSGNLWQTPIPGPVPQLLAINKALAGKATTPNRTSGYFIPSAMGTNTITDAAHASQAPIGDSIIGRSSGYTLDFGVVTGNASNILTVSPNFTYSGVGGLGWMVIGNTPDSVTEWNLITGKIQVYSVGSPAGYSVPTQGIPLTISGNYITVSGIHLQGSDTTNVLLTGSHDKLISDSLDFGLDGVQLNSSVSDTIQNCYIAHMGDNAVLKKNTANYNNVYTGNYLYDIGMITGMGRTGNTYQSYCGMLVGDSGSIAKFNFLDSIGYIGIAWYGSGSVIDSNIIGNTTQIKVDGAAIYTWYASAPTFAQQPQVIGNVMYNGGGPLSLNGTTLNNSSASSAVYPDNYSKGIFIGWNSAYNFNGPAFFDHGAGNIWEYNTALGSGYCDFLAAEVGPVITSLTVKYNNFGSATMTVPAMRFTTVNNDLTTFGSVDSNWVAGSTGSMGFWTFSTGGSDPGTFRSLSNWTAATGYDTHSTYNTGPVSMAYNVSGIQYNYSLPGHYRWNGTDFYGIFPLPIYQSQLFILLTHGQPLKALNISSMTHP